MMLIPSFTKFSELAPVIFTSLAESTDRQEYVINRILDKGNIHNGENLMQLLLGVVKIYYSD
jgi:hypothetical protein